MNIKNKVQQDAFGKALTSWLLIVIAVHFNVFDLASSSGAASTSWFYSVFSPFVSDRLTGEPSVVVMYDTDQMAALNEMSQEGETDGGTLGENKRPTESWTWPLSFDQHAKLVNTLAEFSPCAVFFDIGFYQERGATQELEKALRLNKEIQQRRKCIDASGNSKEGNDPAPIFFADLVSDPSGFTLPGNERKTPEDYPMLQRFMAAGVQMTPVRWVSSENNYPTTVEYDQENGGKTVKPTPGATLWNSWCEVTQDGKCGDIIAARGEISLAWGRGNHSEQRNLPGGGSCLGGRDGSTGNMNGVLKFGANYIESFSLLFARIGAALGLRDETIWQTCPYALTLPASWLAGANRLVAWCPDAAKIEKVVVEGVDYCSTRDIMRFFIDGRIVLVGANFPGTDDFVPSPVNGRVPGIYYHANAVENLLRFGKDYRSKPEGTAGYLWDAAQLAGLLYFLYVLKSREVPIKARINGATTAVHQWVTRHPVTYLRATAVTIGATLSMAVLLLILVTMAFTLLGWMLALLILGLMPIEPANWLGILATLSGSAADMIAQASVLALVGLLLTEVSGARKTRKTR
jgi:CHASE2 domain-containing sensor protein